jgi:deoxyribonuclease-4
MPYLPNLAAPEGETYKKSRMTLYEEIERSYALGISNIVIHLGSHLGSGEDKGIDQIVKACNFAIDEFKDKNRKHIPINVLLENSAGQKNSIGSKFEQLGMLLDKLNNKQYGICLDTCHAFSAGYDLRNKDKVNNVVEAFDKFVGIKHLKVLHLNDSKFNLNENKDRHEHIGLGHIGKEGMREILNTKYFSDVPIIMETPVDEKRGNKENMDVVSELIRTN